MKRAFIISVLLLICLNQVDSSHAKKTSEPSPVILLASPPTIQPNTLPQTQIPGGNAGVSVDTYTNTQDFTRYTPYNSFPRELDLWNLEGARLVRSEAILSPDRRFFVYTEALFMPQVRQTISKLYQVSVPPLPAPRVERLPSEELAEPTPVIDYSLYENRYKPAHYLKERRVVASVGYSKVIPYAFQTYTVVDWSASGHRVLFKQRSGVLHVGLKTSDILVFDQTQGTTTIYPEVHRIIKNYWKTQANLPHIDDIAWDIQPLGWEPGSDNAILLKAWAYDQHEKKFLGIWQYDINAERTQLLSLDDQPVSVASNGWLAESNIPKPAHQAKTK